MDHNSLSYKTLKNISYSFLGYAWPVVFSVFITPVVVHKLGIVDYGIFILVNTITAFLSLTDLGLSVALIKYVAEYHAKANQRGLDNLLASAQTLYIFIGVVGFLIFFTLGKYFLPIFKIPGESDYHILIVFCLAGLLFFINTANSVYVTIPSALQRLDIANKLNMLYLTLLNLTMLALVIAGFKLKAIFLANIVFSILITLFYRHYFKKLLPGAALRFGWAKEEIKKTYRFGILAAITNLASNSLIQLDRLLIPIFTGPAQLTYYSLPGNVAQKTAGITGSLGSIFFPLSSALQGMGDREKIAQIYKKTFRNITVIAAAVSVSIGIFAYPILYFWLGKEFADRGAFVLVLLTVTYFILALYAPLTSFLLGLGKVKFLTISSVSLAVINLILLLVLVPKYGIAGAAWAYLGGVLPVPILFYWAEKNFLRLSNMAGFYFRLYAKIFFTTTVFFLLCKFFIVKLIVSKAALIIIGPLAVVLYLLLYFLFGFMEQEDLETFGSLALMVKNRVLLKN